MYGDGFTSRSTRYTASGSTGSTRSNRCASTTWKMSPSRMCSFAASTAVAHASALKLRRTLGQLGRARRRAGARAGTAAGGRARRPAWSSRATAASYSRVERRPSSRRAAGTRSRSGSSRWRKWSNAATCPASEHTASGKPRSSVGTVGQPLDLAHGVVADPADDAAVERRELGAASARGSARSSASSAASVPSSDGTPSGGVTAEPLDVPAARHERARRIAAEEREPAPAFGVLDRLEQEAFAVADELHERRQRRLEVGEHLAPDRHDRVVARERRRTRRRADGRGAVAHTGPGVAPLAERAEEAAALAGVARAPALLLDHEQKTSMSQS